MNNSNPQNAADNAAAEPARIRGPFSPAPKPDGVTTRPTAAKGDDDLMSQPPVNPPPVKKS